MNEKRVAKEWLYLLGCLLWGFVAMPVLFYWFGSLLKPPSSPDCSISSFCTEFYLALLGFGSSSGSYVPKGAVVFVWSIVLGPYFLFQFVRSVVWAWKTVRGGDA